MLSFQLGLFILLPARVIATCLVWSELPQHVVILQPLWDLCLHHIRQHRRVYCTALHLPQSHSPGLNELVDDDCAAACNQYTTAPDR